MKNTWFHSLLSSPWIGLIAGLVVCLGQTVVTHSMEPVLIGAAVFLGFCSGYVSRTQEHPSIQDIEITHISKLPPVQSTMAQLEGYYVKMFGEMMGPFTEAEIRQGASAREFPEDATVSRDPAGAWTSIQTFRTPTPPPFRKGPMPPPFRGPKKSAA